MAVIDGKKRCPKCGETFVAAEGFHRSYGNPDGYQGWCKSCTRKCQDATRAAWIARNRAANMAKFGNGGEK